MKAYFLTISALLFIFKNQAFAQVQPRPLSVHVLDSDFGGNAANMTCKLYKQRGGGQGEGAFVLLSTQVTDDAGRIAEFLSIDNYTAGRYRIWFGTKDYYTGRNVLTFFPAVQITFDATNPTTKDYHIPLVLSPFGFNTYRGS